VPWSARPVIVSFHRRSTKLDLPTLCTHCSPQPLCLHVVMLQSPPKVFAHGGKCQLCSHCHTPSRLCCLSNFSFSMNENLSNTMVRSPGTKSIICNRVLSPTSPLSMRQMAQRTGWPVSTISAVVKHYRLHGTHSSLPKSGRPSKITPQGERRVLREMHSNPQATYDVFGAIINISPSSVGRLANRNGLYSRICRKKPLVSAANVMARLKWAEEVEEMDWRRVMFTDESCFKVGETSSVARCLRPIGEAFNPRYTAPKLCHGVAVHVWGAIVHGRKLPLVRFDLQKAHTKNGTKIQAQKITSEVYSSQILWGPLSNYVGIVRHNQEDLLVVEDGASVHNKGVSPAIREICGIPRLTHPASSPDLNPIENAWAWIKRKLRQRQPCPTSLDQLWERLQALWDEMPQDMIDQWIDGMDRRRVALLTAKGFATKY